MSNEQHPKVIIKCPACGQFHLHKKPHGGHLHSAANFSDGRLSTPLMSEHPLYVKCRYNGCDVFFKAREHSGELHTHEGHEELMLDFLTADEYRKAIGDGLFNVSKHEDEWHEDVFSLRVLLWRAYNRQSVEKGLTKAERAAYDENCREIITLLSKKKDDESLLLKAELYRNIGNFDMCICLLRQIKKPENFRVFIDEITAACEAENHKTIEISG